MFDNAQVVRDEEEGKAEPALKVLKKIDDLRLDRHVQCRNRFVRNDEFRIHGQRPRNADTLALPPAEFVGIPAGIVRPETHGFQEFRHAFPRIAAIRELVDLSVLQPACPPTVMRGFSEL